MGKSCFSNRHDKDKSTNFNQLNQLAHVMSFEWPDAALYHTGDHTKHKHHKISFIDNLKLAIH